MKVLFFAQARVAAGGPELLLSSQTAMTQAEFWMALIAERPALQVFRGNARLARNEMYLQVHECLEPGDEIAVIPPVSGG